MLEQHSELFQSDIGTVKGDAKVQLADELPKHNYSKLNVIRLL